MRFAVTVLFVVAGTALAQEGNFSIKTEKAAPPPQLKGDIGKLLRGEAVKFEAGGKTIAEIWFRKELPASATAEQVKNGLTYKELKQSELIGAVRFVEDWTDYRKQKIKAGVYTLRLGFQPQDGDHAGTSPYQDFVVVIDAAKEPNAAILDPKEMIERSAKSTGTGHPGVFMLFPSSKTGAPQLASQANNHWVLFATADATAAGGKAPLGIGLTLVGHTE